MFMIHVDLPFLDIEADVKFDENGVSVSVKKFDINNFTIDKVFKHIDKICGKKTKKEKKLTSTESNSKPMIDTNDEYLIEIQL